MAVQRLRQPPPPSLDHLISAQRQYLESLAVPLPSPSTREQPRQILDASQAPEAGDDLLDWEDQGSVDSRFSDTVGDSVLTSDRKSKRLLPLEVLRSRYPEAGQANEVQDRVLGASLNHLALQDFGKAQLLLRAFEGSFAAHNFANNRHRTQRGRSFVSMPTEGVPSFAGCAIRGTVVSYKPLTSVPVVKGAFPGASLVAALDKVFSPAPRFMSLSMSVFESLERQLALAIESTAKIDSFSFTDGLAASLGEYSLEEADPFMILTRIHCRLLLC